jgi:hypothetical protein
MTLTDYLLDSVLVLLVLRQLRESRLDLRAMLLPLGIVGWVAHSYLHALPTGGNNLLLIGGLTLVGVLSGVVSGFGTRVRSDGGRYALVKAGWVAAGVWVLSMSGRFAFAVWASHGGGPSLYRFSVAHHLSASVWTDALVLMALGEVVTRVAIMYLRSRRVLAAGRPAPAPAPLPV